MLEAESSLELNHAACQPTGRDAEKLIVHVYGGASAIERQRLKVQDIEHIEEVRPYLKARPFVQ